MPIYKDTTGISYFIPLFDLVSKDPSSTTMGNELDLQFCTSTKTSWICVGKIKTGSDFYYIWEVLYPQAGIKPDVISVQGNTGSGLITNKFSIVSQLQPITVDWNDTLKQFNIKSVDNKSLLYYVPSSVPANDNMLPVVSYGVPSSLSFSLNEKASIYWDGTKFAKWVNPAVDTSLFVKKRGVLQKNQLLCVFDNELVYDALNNIQPNQCVMYNSQGLVDQSVFVTSINVSQQQLSGQINLNFQGNVSGSVSGNTLTISSQVSPSGVQVKNPDSILPNQIATFSSKNEIQGCVATLSQSGDAVFNSTKLTNALGVDSGGTGTTGFSPNSVVITNQAVFDFLQPNSQQIGYVLTVNQNGGVDFEEVPKPAPVPTTLFISGVECPTVNNTTSFSVTGRASVIKQTDSTVVVDVKDQLPITQADGSILYTKTGGVWSELTKPTVDSVLSCKSGVVGWGTSPDPPRLWKQQVVSGTQTIDEYTSYVVLEQTTCVFTLKNISGGSVFRISGGGSISITVPQNVVVKFNDQTFTAQTISPAGVQWSVLDFEQVTGTNILMVINAVGQFN